MKSDWNEAAGQGQLSKSERPLAYTIRDAVKVAGISRSRLYEELKAGRLTAKKIGRCTLIPRESIEAWLNSLADYPASAAPSDARKFTP